MGRTMWGIQQSYWTGIQGIRKGPLPQRKCSATPENKLEDADQQIEAETLADISESFDIEAVPSFLLLRVRAVIAPSFPCNTTKHP